MLLTCPIRLLWDGSGHIASLSLFKSPHRAWLHKPSAFAIGRFSSWIGICTYRPRQGHQPPTHRKGDAAVYTTIQRVSHPGRSAFVRCFAHCSAFVCSVGSPPSSRSPASAGIPSSAAVLCLPEMSRILPFQAARPFRYWPLAFGWRGLASRHFRHLPRPSLRWAMPASALVPHWHCLLLLSRFPSYVLLFTSHGTTAQFLKPTPALRPVFLVLTRACVATQSSSHTHASWWRALKVRRWSSRLATRRQGGVPVDQPLFSRNHSPPGRRILTARYPADHLHYLRYAAKETFPDRRLSSRSSSLARLSPKGLIETTADPTGHCHSHICPDHDWSNQWAWLAYLLPRGRVRSRLIQPVVFTRLPAAMTAYPMIQPLIFRTARGPAVHLRSFIRDQQGVSGSPGIQPFIFARYLPPRRRIRTPSGAAVHLRSLSAARRTYPDPEWFCRSSSSAFCSQEGVSVPREVQPSSSLPYPPPGRRIRTARVQPFFLTHLSAVRMTHSDRGWSSRSRQLAYPPPGEHPGGICVQPFVVTRPSAVRDSAYWRTTRVFQPCTSLSYLPLERRIRNARASRSSLLACLPPRGRIRTAGARNVVRGPHSRSTSSPPLVHGLSASGWSSLIVPAVRIYSSHALGHQDTSFVAQTSLGDPLPYGLRLGGLEAV